VSSVHKCLLQTTHVCPPTHLHAHSFVLVKQFDKKMDATQQGVLCQKTEQSLWIKAKNMVRLKMCGCVGLPW
jgi:hypothetical protein